MNDRFITRILVKVSVFLLTFTIWSNTQAQTKDSPSNFINSFEDFEGKYFEGKIVVGGREGDGFVGNRLLMHVARVSKNEIKIPFFVGEDKSRTWIITKNDNGTLTLKHDHRHEDGSADSISFYGGDAPNVGWDTLQTFPADPYTCALIDYACHNVWWITMDGKIFTYNLRRIGSERIFTVSFDLTKTVESEMKPW